MNIDSPPRVLVVTSPLPGDGKSTTAANLAMAIAASGEVVYLVDGDLRRSTVAGTFGLPNQGGLTDVLVGAASLTEVVHSIGAAGRLRVLTAGSVAPNPTELLGSQRMGAVLREMVAEGIVLIDAPPLLPVTDGAVLAASSDGAVLVASANRTTYEQLQTALEHLGRVSSTPLGIILNRVPRRRGDAMGYYRYDYAPREDEPTPVPATTGGRDRSAGAQGRRPG